MTDKTKGTEPGADQGAADALADAIAEVGLNILHSPGQAKLAKALSQFQAKAEQPTQNKTGKVSGKNRAGQTYEYEYKYADLHAVLTTNQKLTGECGLALVQTPWLAGGDHFILITDLLHESGEWRRGTYPIGLDGTPQQIGGRLTYAKRYSAAAMLGLAAEDDDDAAAATAAHKQGAGRGQAQGQQQQQQRREPDPSWQAKKDAIALDKHLRISLNPNDQTWREAIKKQPLWKWDADEVVWLVPYTDEIAEACSAAVTNERRDFSYEVVDPLAGAEPVSAENAPDDGTVPF